MSSKPRELPPSGQRRTQAQRRAESERRILEAAAELYGEQGYGATTMEQIGARAGYSAALIARKFGSKLGVTEALLATIRERTGAAIDPAADGHVVDVVRRYVGLIADGDAGSRALYVLMAESVGPLRDLAELFARHNRSFVAAIAAGIRREQQRGRADLQIDRHSLAADLVARIRGITLLWLIDPDGVDRDAMTARLIEEFQAALTPSDASGAGRHP